MNDFPCRLRVFNARKWTKCANLIDNSPLIIVLRAEIAKNAYTYQLITIITHRS